MDTLKKSEYYGKKKMQHVRIAPLFVYEALHAQKCDHGFVYQGLMSSSLIINGTVTLIERIPYDLLNMVFYIYNLDDGTGCINCVLPCPQIDNEYLNTMNENFNSYNGDFLQMLKLTSLGYERLNEKFDYRNIKRGDDVRITGVLKQEKTLKFVFVEQIYKVTKLSEKIKDMMKLYYFREIIKGT